MENFIEKMIGVVQEYQTNENLTYNLDDNKIICFYDDVKFLEIHCDGFIYTSNMNININMNNIQNSHYGFKLFLTTEIMLRGASILEDGKMG